MKWVLKLLRLCLVHFCDLNTKYRGWARDGVQFGRCSESIEYAGTLDQSHILSFLLVIIGEIDQMKVEHLNVSLRNTVS